MQAKKKYPIQLPRFTLDGDSKTWNIPTKSIVEPNFPLIWMENHFLEGNPNNIYYKGTGNPEKNKILRPPSAIIGSFAEDEVAEFLSLTQDVIDDRGTIFGNNPNRLYGRSPVAGVPRNLSAGGALDLEKWIAGEVCVIADYGGFTSEGIRHNYNIPLRAGSFAECASHGKQTGGILSGPHFESVLDDVTCTPNEEGIESVAFMLEAKERFNRLLVIYTTEQEIININTYAEGYYCKLDPVPNSQAIIYLQGINPVATTQKSVDSQKAAMESLVEPLEDSAVVLANPTVSEIALIVRDWILSGM